MRLHFYFYCSLCRWLGLEDCCLPSWLSDCDFPYFKYFYVHFLPMSSNDSSNKHFCAHHLPINHETYITDMPEDGGFGGLLTLPPLFLGKSLNPILINKGVNYAYQIATVPPIILDSATSLL